jgi:hypothetical protein
MKIKSLCAIVLAALLSTLSTAHAGLIDEYTTASSEYAQVYNNGTALGVTIEGAGVNQVVKLYVTNYTSGVGSNYWDGVVPNGMIVVNGLNSITVNVANTCELTAIATYGSDYCFAVNATFTKDDYLWKTNGVTQYKYNDIIYQLIGYISAFSGTVTGTVSNASGNTVIDSSKAYLGKYTDVTVEVSTAN